MKHKPYNTDDSSLEVNIVSEPEMTYAYVNQNERDAVLIEKFDEITYPPQPILEPDEKLHNAISMDELKESVLAHIDKLYAGK